MEADKLLIVAHPDDETLWGGANLLARRGWHVVCATNRRNSTRSKEFYKTMADAGVLHAEMFGVHDRYTESPQVSDRIFKSNTAFMNRLRQLSRKNWKLVLTHSASGEYGHEHHKTVNKVVKSIFPAAKEFSVAQRSVPRRLMKQKQELCRWYAETQNTPRLVYENRKSKLSDVEKKFVYREKLFVRQRSQNELPAIIHQIWVGGRLPRYKKALLDSVKSVSKSQKVEYRLWRNADVTRENFPLTYDYLQKAKRKSRWAQMADLMRYEIVYRYGGVYLDSNFEISKEFWKTVKSKIRGNKTMVVANEDPCGLRCTGTGGNVYLSNAFFAAVELHPALKSLTRPEFLDKIDFNSKFVNRETGPYPFGKAVKEHRRSVVVLPTKSIYPFWVNETEYRKASPNVCIVKVSEKGVDGISIDRRRKLVKNCAKKHFPKSLAVYHSGLGGSWSW